MKSGLLSLTLLLSTLWIGCGADRSNLLSPSAADGPGSGASALYATERHAVTGEKVSICHATGRERYVRLEISPAAESAHQAHGDARVGEQVPTHPDMKFGEDCGPVSTVTLRTVTSGYVLFTDEPGSISLAGSGFDVGFGWAPLLLSGTFWSAECAAGCAPGAVVDYGTSTYGFSDSPFISQGPAVIGNVAYDEVFFDGQLTLSGPAVTLPNAGNEDGIGHEASGPFTFEGRILAYADETRTGVPVFTLDLVGSGTATTVFYTVQGRWYQADEDLVYRFAP
jgi:hypothetical protein